MPHSFLHSDALMAGTVYRTWARMWRGRPLLAGISRSEPDSARRPLTEFAKVKGRLLLADGEPFTEPNRRPSLYHLIAARSPFAGFTVNGLLTVTMCDERWRRPGAPLHGDWAAVCIVLRPGSRWSITAMPGCQSAGKTSACGRAAGCADPHPGLGPYAEVTRPRPSGRKQQP
jgi:hypothetical protein